MPHPSRQELERAIGLSVRAAIEIVGDDTPFNGKAMVRFLRAMTRLAARPLLRARVPVSNVVAEMAATVASLAEELEAAAASPLPANVHPLKPKE